MALQPMKMLSFDWNAPPSLPEARQQRTFVVVRLFDVDGRSTRVTLHHTGWGNGGEWDQMYAYFDRAWGNVLDNLKKRYDTEPQDWTAWIESLRNAHSADAASAPKQCLHVSAAGLPCVRLVVIERRRLGACWLELHVRKPLAEAFKGMQHPLLLHIAQSLENNRGLATRHVGVGFQRGIALQHLFDKRVARLRTLKARKS
jgi:hypothetical protein